LGVGQQQLGDVVSNPDAATLATGLIMPASVNLGLGFVAALWQKV
jgi:hypothetical protein